MIICFPTTFGLKIKSFWYYIPVTMVAGAKYDFSFWTKRIGGITVYVNETSDQVTPLYTYTGTQTLDNNWKQTICTSYIALASGQVYIQIAYSGSTYGSGTGYLDDVKVIETSAGNQNSWSITGSSGTNMVSNFIGTSDAQGLVFKTNSIERAQFDPTGAFILKTSAVFKEDIKLEKGFTFDGNKGISFTPSTASSPAKFHYGNKPTSILPINCAAGPQALANHQFGGMLQIYDTDASGNYVANSGLLNFQTWSGGSSIDASIGGQTGQGGLLLNYFCGNNTYINTGVNGGNVVMGDKVYANKNLKIGSGWSNISGNTSLEINQNDNNSSALKINTSNNTIKAFVINNTNHASNSLEILADGATQINSQNANPFTIKQPSTGNVILNVNQNGQVTIGLRHPAVAHSDALFGVDGKAIFTSVWVTQTSWADDVFKPNYQLPDLSYVETYYSNNQHLPNIPSEKEVLENGVNVSDMQKLLLQKIEELTLYTVDLNKQVKQLKENNYNLQQQLDNLKN